MMIYVSKSVVIENGLINILTHLSYDILNFILLDN